MFINLGNCGPTQMRIRSLLSVLLIFSCCTWADEKVIPSKKRLVGVADAIEMTQWSNPDYFVGATPSDSVGLFSPDKTKFVVVLKRGNIEHNTVDYSVLLFKTGDVHKSVRPQLLVTLSSSSNREGIASVKWLDDNRTLVFLGEAAGETPEVYTLNTETRDLKKRTNHSTAIVAYDITPDGKVVVYLAVVQQKVDPGDIRRNGVVITSQNPTELFPLSCDSSQRTELVGRSLFVQRGDTPAVEISSSDYLNESFSPVLSPTGRYALLVANLGTIPAAWSEYQDSVLHSRIEDHRIPGAWSLVTQFVLLDIANNKLSPLLDAPLYWSNHGAIWAKDENSLVVSGTYLPLESAGMVSSKTRRQRAFVAEVRLPSREVVEVTDTDVTVLGWAQSKDREILVGAKSNHNPVGAYEKIGSIWKAAEVPSTSDWKSDPFDLVLEEDINTPPRIVVRDLQDNHQNSLLLDLNPQFADLEFGRVEAVTWKATDGHRVKGGLYLPPHYVQGKRYPLVIQTHGFNASRFWIDGPWSSGFAAQPLAARDIVVIQVGSAVDPADDEKYAETPQEAPRQMAAYEGAIDYLDERGIIDRKNVGIVGFSRTVYYAEYALTHSKYEFRAASLVDGIDGGYMNYLLWPVADYTLVNGSAPVGSGLMLWLENSPGFNLDKVNTPVRLEYYQAGYFLGGWQWFSGLTLLGKPVDFVWLPDGYHMLKKPWERLVSQQGAVDWFLFWLRNEEDSAPNKIPQYKRWRELRRLRDKAAGRPVNKAD